MGTYAYDCASQLLPQNPSPSFRTVKFDGDGHSVRTSVLFTSNNTEGVVTYYLRSSVLGSTIAKLDVNGQRIESYVYAGGRKLATADSYSGGVTWSHTDPVIGSHGVSFPAGGYGPDREFNADGIDVGLDAPQPESEVPDTEFVKLTRPSGCGMLDLTCQSCAFGGSSLTCAEVSQLQRVYGERFFDLPGVDNEMARAEGLYLGRVHSAFDTYNYNQTHKTKPVLREVPKLTKEEADRLNRENAGVGNDESRTGGTSIQILDPFEFVLQQPAEGSFLDCVGKAGLRGTNFNEDAADLINKLNQWEYSASRKQKIVLEDGLMQVNVRFGENDPRGFEFINTLYGDLNGDGKEEVVVTLAIESTGTGRAHAIFVYTLNDDSPKMLWVHETGDRAVEGLRNVYIEDRILLIEQYDPLTGNTATTFTRSYYEWSGQSFRIIKAVRVANDLEHGEPRVLLNRSGK